jgi:transposase
VNRLTQSAARDDRAKDPTVDADVGPDPEVIERPQRRRFTAEYKVAIVREADAAKDSGAVGALLRREGLYSSHLVMWRKKYRAGARQALALRRGPPIKHTVESKHLAAVVRENAQLRRRLAQAEALLELQKKASEILGITLQPPPNDEGD